MGQRYKFGLVDLVVVCGVLVILAGFILPAVQTSKVTVHPTMCIRQMKQVGNALIIFHGLKRSLPNSGTWASELDAPEGIKPTAELLDSGGEGWPGQGGDPKRNDIRWDYPLHSWVLDILPYLEGSTTVCDDWAERDQVRLASGLPIGTFDEQSDTQSTKRGEPADHYTIGQTSLRVLVCAGGPTIVPGKGNLSYVVNSGATLLPHIPTNNENHGLRGSYLDLDGDGQGSKKLPDADDVRAARHLALMFPGSLSRDTEWDYKRTIDSITDGASNTVLLGENVRAGYVARYPERNDESIWYDPNHIGSPGMGTIEGSWANPDPYLSAFFISDDFADAHGSCTLGANKRARWMRVNGSSSASNYRSRNGASSGEGIQSSLKTEEGWPYLSSFHRGGVNVIFCDGSARFLTDSIDGEILAKILSPAGESLDSTWPVFQTALDEDAEGE